MKSAVTHLAVLLLLLSLPSIGWTAPIVINFDNLNDLDSLTNQFSGLTFSHATVLTSGLSLNEFEFPPKSGSNVVFDDGGALSVTFSSPVTNVAGFFTYQMPVTLRVFSGSNVLLGSKTSLFSSNLALSGDTGSSPNELLQLSFAGISRVSITGGPAGGSFALDDFTYTSQVVQTPEPISILSLLSGLAVLGVLRKKNKIL